MTAGSRLYLEYQFSLAASDAAMRYRADEYYQGRLDWYSVDRDASDEPLGDLQPAAPSQPAVHTFFPTQIVFEGMPNTRWWAFEDRKTNFGAIAPNTTELGKLLFVEFGLIYANDWFLLPQTLPVGTVAEVAGLMVTNAFGERFWIGAAGSGANEGWQRWSMFTNVRRSSHEIPADSGLLMVPSLPKVQEGPPIVDVTLIRDEIANMVWAIETRVPLPSGESAAGRESALQTVEFYRRILEQRFATSALEPLDAASAASIRYEVMSTVPEHWIPFIPVHVDNDVRRIQLQRAALPRLLERDPRAPRKVEPRTPLMREGLDRVEKAPYFVHNEQVPRAGTRVYQAYQRTRWYGGRVITWLGARKQTGRGMGSSGLRFDSIRNVPPTAT